MIFNEGDDTHLASEGRANKRVYLINFSDHLSPAFGRDMIFPFNDRRMEGRDSGLAYLASALNAGGGYYGLAEYITDFPLATLA